VPGYPAVVYDDDLWRFVRHVEPFCDGVGQLAIFDDKDQTAKQVVERLGESYELFVDVRAYGALRAMLENKDSSGFRPLEKLFEISILAQLD
jgi:hypothetical protein